MRMEKFKFLPKEKISKLPKVPGVYCFVQNNEILYIGKAANLKERVKNHFLQPCYKDYLFLEKIEKVGYIKTDSEIEALILEANLIKKYQPKFNVIWRDDKNYFFVGKSNEDFPRIFITHQPRIKNLTPKEKIEFVGPFVEGKSLKLTLKILRKIFPFRSCKKIPSRPCLFYHLGYCPAPCLLKAKLKEKNSKEFFKIKRISQKNAQKVMKILREGKSFILRELKKEMKEAVKKLEFEEAGRIRDQILALEKIMANARIFEKEKPERESWPKVEKILKEILKIKNKISRIEGYDISQLQGNFAVGSMVTFIEGKPEKSLYRKFKIKLTKGASDVEMIKEVIFRRLKHKEWGFPDLILIDGGKAQLQAAFSQVKNFKIKTKILALAKKENKLYLQGEKEPLFLNDLPREIFNLILKIRDEAHRFAISFHRQLREKFLKID